MLTYSSEKNKRLHPKDALYGGKTNASRLVFESKDASKSWASYYDFCSLYPYCQKYCPYPVGHSETIRDNFKPLNEYFGLVRCAILPPDSLLHPVLPYRHPKSSKLLFPLCKACADSLQIRCNHTDEQRTLIGTWVILEVLEAIKLGYKMITIYEIHHYKENTKEIFKDYIDAFLKIKQEASGYPPGVITDEQKDKYIQSYFEHEGVQLDKAKIEKNPGLRSCSKLALNNLWGRLALNMSKKNLTKFARTENEMNDLFYDDTCDIRDFKILKLNDKDDSSSYAMQIDYRPKEHFMNTIMNTNVVVAAFTTAHARLKLNALIQKLNSRTLYFDTDSVIFSSTPEEEKISTGPYLGDLTNELSEGEVITSFCSGGPKNYSYNTNQGQKICKVKGLSLNAITSQGVNQDVMTDFVKKYYNKKRSADIDGEILEALAQEEDNVQREDVMSFQYGFTHHEEYVSIIDSKKITVCKRTKTIKSAFIRKRYKIGYDKRMISREENHNYETYPWGFK